MNGCSYIDRETGETLLWTKNYNSKVWHDLYKQGHTSIIVEEPFYKNLERKYKKNEN